MVTVRHASKSDRAFWSALDENLSKDVLAEKIRDKRGYVIRCHDKLIGIMRYNLLWDEVPFLTLICLDERYRGSGYGRQAILLWEDEMRALGHQMVMTSTRVDEGAQHFYRKLGYLDRGGIFLDGTPLAQPQEVFMVKVF